MADDDKKNDDKPPAKRVKKTLVGVGAPSAEEIAEAQAAAGKDALDETVEKAREAAEHAKAAAEEAKTAERIAEDAAEEAEEDEKLASAAETEAAAEKAGNDAESAHKDALDAKEAAKEAEHDARVAAKAAAKGDVAAAKEAEEAAERQAERAARDAADAKAAATAAVATAKEADEARISGELTPKQPEKRPALYLAEYESPDALAHAAEKVRDAGYEKWDCHTPYPVHGLDEAMGLPPTKIGYISFAHAIIGIVSAVLMIQYMNNWDYPINVGGKPVGLGAFPSMVPIMFELGVLLTGFGTLFGMLHLAKLPRHHHPIFESDRFDAATDDKFFISVEVADPKFDLEKTRALLESTDPSYLELVEEEVE